MHWVSPDVEGWLGLQRRRAAHLVGVEIPRVGTGQGPNVAVAGSLVLYRLAGLL